MKKNDWRQLKHKNETKKYKWSNTEVVLIYELLYTYKMKLANRRRPRIGEPNAEEHCHPQVTNKDRK